MKETAGTIHEAEAEAQAGPNKKEYYRHPGEHLPDLLAIVDTMVYLYLLEQKDCLEKPLSFIRQSVGPDMEHLDTGEEKIAALQKHLQNLRQKVWAWEKQSERQGIFLPLKNLVRIFGLTPQEEGIIILCLAPELDLKYEKLYACALEEESPAGLPVRLFMELLCYTPDERRDARAGFLPRAPLMHHNLVRFTGVSPDRPLPARTVKLDDRIVNYLLGYHHTLDAQVCPPAKLVFPARKWDSLILEEAQKKQLMNLAKHYFNNGHARPLIIYMQGSPGTGKKAAAGAICTELRLPLLTLDIRDLAAVEAAGTRTGELVKRFFRETLMLPAAAYINHFDLLTGGEPGKDPLERNIIQALQESFPLTFLAGEKKWNWAGSFQDHVVETLYFPTPGYPMRKRLWECFLDVPGLDTRPAAGKFRLTGGQIRAAAAAVRARVQMNGNTKPGNITRNDLHNACRRQTNRGLVQMAREIIPHYTWNDIVLPANMMRQLREICNHVKYRHIVYHQWGFDTKLALGKGLNILFTGPSGTGKTMAVEIIANDLQLDLYKIDLSCIVSKYIGETEKNLSRVFKEAESANAVLFFDEADALFGKRSEVKDAHDRYANIEINYLLQKMEEHEGMVVLASNFRKNIDSAFLRRFDFCLEFPFPDRDYRRAIWEKMFPPGAPMEKNMDFLFLAGVFQLSGGAIKNAALNGAFLAAADTGKLGMKHLIMASVGEYRKMGRTCTPGDIGAYFPLVEGVWHEQ